MHPPIHPLLLAAAATAVVAGAPWFSDGLRALRLRRQLARLGAGGPALESGGLVHVDGRVALDAPLFSPLTQQPCAAYVLEVHGVGAPVARETADQRGFRVCGTHGMAHVDPARARWLLEVTGERTIAAGDRLGAGLEMLLARIPEAMWWRRAGGALRMTERALLADDACHVVGCATPLREMPAELLATGTDAVAAVSPSTGVAITITAGEPLDAVVVSHAAPPRGAFAVPLVRTAGVIGGPLVSLAGLLYLAHAADLLRAAGWRG